MKVLTLTAILVILFICPGLAQQAQIYDNRPKITVNGEAVVRVNPDKIVVSLGIETWDADIMLAKQKNSNILKKAIAAIKEWALRIRTSRQTTYQLNPATRMNTTRSILSAILYGIYLR